MGRSKEKRASELAGEERQKEMRIGMCVSLCCFPESRAVEKEVQRRIRT